MSHMTTRTGTPWLTQEQQRIWRAFLGGITVLMDQLDRDLRTQHDLSLGEYEILVRLSEAPDRSIRMAELAAAVAHSRSRVTHTISRLERDGIVRRDQCSEDGRGVSAVLTDHGFSRAREGGAHPRPRRPRLPHRERARRTSSPPSAASWSASRRPCTASASDASQSRVRRRYVTACGRAASSPRRCTLFLS